MDAGRKDRAMSKATKRHLEKGVLHIEATFNNTKAVLTDEKGNAVISSSAGALGFSGARFGGAKPQRPIARVIIGGLIAMAITMAIGNLFGAAVA